MDHENLLKEWIAAGTANALTSGFLNPMDVAKTRLQANNSGSSLYATLRQLFSEGGFTGKLIG